MLGACAQCLADHEALQQDDGCFLRYALKLLRSHLQTCDPAAGTRAYTSGFMTCRYISGSQDCMAQVECMEYPL